MCVCVTKKKKWGDNHAVENSYGAAERRFVGCSPLASKNIEASEEFLGFMPLSVREFL